MKRLVLLALVAACWRNAPPPSAPEPEPPSAPQPGPPPAPEPEPAHAHVQAPPREIDVALAQFEQFTDDMCNCTDSACAQAVADEMTRWAQEQARTQPPPLQLDADQERAAALGERLGKCMQKAMENEATAP